MDNVVSIGVSKYTAPTKFKKFDLMKVQFLWVYLLLGKAALWVAILWTVRQ